MLEGVPEVIGEIVIIVGIDKEVVVLGEDITGAYIP
jgi:hypothetical protein